MGHVVRTLGALVAIAAAAALLALGLIYARSEWIIRQPHHAALAAVPVPHDAASIAEGHRLATLVGCPSCHGSNNDGKGAVWTPVDWKFGQIAPPALARAIAPYSNAGLARLIRHGQMRNGASVFVMPAVSMTNLADDDVGRIIAWLRSLRPAKGDVTEPTWFGPLGRWQIVTGALKPSFQLEVLGPKQRPAEPGRYLAYAVCSECHSLTEPREREGQTVPPLAAAVAGYSLADFTRLMRTGVGAGGRDLGLMSIIAKENLHALTDGEIAAIHAEMTKEAGAAPPTE